VTALRIGPEIDPGVPWTYSEAGSARRAEPGSAEGAEPGSAGGAARPGLHLALKSGNFGARDFFLKAFGV
jgi:uncharacterized protein YgbK (DUF1537 family)